MYANNLDDAFSVFASGTTEEWVKSDKYMDYPKYHDEDYTYIEGRTIGDIAAQISVQGEAYSQYISFMMDRYYDGIDLMGMSIWIHYELKDGSGSEDSPVNVMYNDSTIRFNWIVPEKATQQSGDIKIGVWVNGTAPNTKAYILKTEEKIYTIHSGLIPGSGITQPDQNWFENFVEQMDSKVSTAQGHANDAQASKTAAAGSAAASAKSATASARALEENKAYVESQKEAFAGYNRRETDLKYANALIDSASGTTQVTVSDAWEAPIPGLEIAGKSEQGADPSPDNPQEIVSTDVTAVTVTGAQLLDIPSLSTKNYLGVTYSPQPDGTVIATGTSTGTSYIDLRIQEPLPLGDYYISGCPNGGGGDGYQLMAYAVNNGSYKVIGSDIGNGSRFTVTDDNPIAIRIVMRLSISGPLTFKPMLNAGDTALPWEPYQSKTASITLTKPLRGIGDYRDEITMTNRIDRCMELTFDGSEDWGVYTSGSRTGFSAINVLPISMNNRNGICNQALVGGNEEVERIILGSNNQNLYYFYCPFYDTTVADKGLSAWKAHLAAHPLKVVTYLDTPVETDLGADTIAALAELTTYKGRTTTTVTAEGPEPDVAVEYVQDTNVVIAELKKLIEGIQNVES